jgi:ABC-type glycerol-3-phosphate transport system substrate-binding protein
MKTTPKLRLPKTPFFASLAVMAATALAGVLTSQAKEHVDLQFWDMIWGPPEYIDTGKALVAQFNQEHSDVTVTYRSIPWSNWYQTFLTAIGSGTAPDLSTGAGYQAVQLYDQGAILPIDDVISAWKANGKLDDFLPKTVDTLKYDNHYVALPWAIDIRVWYYRKDLLEQAHVQPPANWQEFKAAVQALTNDKAGQYGLVACGDTLGSHWLYTLILNNGGGLFTQDRKPDLGSERNLYKQGKHPAEAKEFLEWWSEHEKDLWTKGHVTQLPVRKSFAADPYFQGNAETKFILENYVPVGKTTATHATEIFPKLNEVEGEGVMQTLMQNLLQGKDVNSSVRAASGRLKSIMED